MNHRINQRGKKKKNLDMNLVSQVALAVKSLPTNTGDTRNMSLISGSGRFPGIGHGNLLQCPCLESPIDRGAREFMAYRVVKESDMTKVT